MDINTIIPLLDSLSQLAEKTPVPYVALAGAILAGIVVILKKIQNSKSGAPEVVIPPQPANISSNVAPVAADKKLTDDIAAKSLK